MSSWLSGFRKKLGGSDSSNINNNTNINNNSNNNNNNNTHDLEETTADSTGVTTPGPSSNVKISDVKKLDDLQDLTLSSSHDVVALLRKAADLKSEPLAKLALDMVYAYLVAKMEAGGAGAGAGAAPTTAAAASTKAVVGTHGGLGYIDQILVLRLNVTDIVEKALKVICCLVDTDVANRQRFHHSGYCYRVVKACQLHIYSPSLVTWGLKVIRHLTLEDSLVPKFILAGVTDFVGNVMRHHIQATPLEDVHTNPTIALHAADSGTTDVGSTTTDGSTSMLAQHETILEWTGKVIYNICYNDESTGSKLSDVGCCDLIVVLMIALLHEVNQGINVDTSTSKSTSALKQSQYCFIIVGSLARRNDDNKAKLRSLGACELVVRIAQQPLWLSDASFSDSVCWAIANMSYPDEANQQTLCDLGACPLVIEALNTHLTADQSTVECLRAIRNLAHNCPKALDIFLDQDISNVMLKVLHYYNNSPSVMQWAWFAIASLTQSPSLVLRFGEVGICRITADMLIRYKQNPDILQWVAIAVSELSLEPNLHEAFSNERICKLIVEAMALHMDNDEVLEECCFTISNVIQWSNDNNEGAALMPYSELSKYPIKYDLVTSALVLDVLLKILQVHEKNAGNRGSANVLRNTLMVLSYLFVRPDKALIKRYRTTDNYITNTSPEVVSSAASAEFDLNMQCIEAMDTLHLHLARSLFEHTLGSLKIATKILTRFPYNGQQSADQDPATVGAIVEFTLHVLSEAYLLTTSDDLDSPLHQSSSSTTTAAITQGSNMVPCIASSVYAQLINARVSQYAVTLFNALLKGRQSSTPQKFLQTFTTSSSGFLGVGSSSSSAGIPVLQLAIPGAAPVTDCVGVIVQIGLAHCQFSSTLEAQTKVQSLILPLLTLINDLAASPHAPALQARLGACGACHLLVYILDFYRDVPSVVTLTCTTITNLTQSYNGTAATQNNRHLFDSNICDALVTLLRQYLYPATPQGEGGSQDVLYFIAMAIDCVCSWDESRKKLSQLGACSLVVHVVDKFRASEGLATVALSALGSLLQPGHSQALVQRQILLAESEAQRMEDIADRAVEEQLPTTPKPLSPLAVLCTIEAQYRDNAIICQSVCRIVAFLASHNTPLQLTMTSESTGKYRFCEMVLNVLSRFITDAPDTTKFACLAIAELASSPIVGPNNNPLTAGSNIEVVNIFRDLMVCPIVTSLLQRYLHLEPIAEACCRTVVNLAPLNHLFGAAGICELVLNALKMHQANECVLEWVCRAIGVLSEHPDNVGILCEHHAPERILTTLQLHIAQDSSLLGLTKISSLFGPTSGGGTATGVGSGANSLERGTSTTIQHSIASSGGGTNKANATSGSGDSSGGRSMASAMGMLTKVFGSSSSNQNASSGASSSSSGTPTAGTVLWGLHAIYYLLMGSDCNPAYQEVLYANGICDVLVRLLSKYTENEAMALATCRAMVMMVHGNIVVRDRFGGLGLCSAMVELLQIYPGSLEVANWASRAIAQLARDNESNVAKLASAGVCETIPVAIQAHQSSELMARYGSEVIYYIAKPSGSSSDPSSTLVTQSSSTAIGNGQSASNGGPSAATPSDSSSSGQNSLGARLGHSGACEAVVSSIRLHISNIPVILVATQALGQLALTLGNSHWLGPAGACEALIDVLRIHHSEARIVCAAWNAISYLCSVNHNRERFYALRVANVLVASVAEHKESPDVAECAMQVVARLAEYRQSCNQFIGRYQEFPTFYMDSLSNGSSSESLDGTELVDPLDTVEKSETVEGQIKDLLTAFNIVVMGNRLAFHTAGLYEQILSILQTHISSDRVVYRVLKAISILSHGRESVIERLTLGRIGACDLIIKAVIFHVENVGICIVGAHAVKSLCSPNDLNFLFSAGLVRALSGNTDATQLLPCIAGIQRFNQRKMEAAGVCQIFANVLRVHLKLSLNPETQAQLISGGSSSLPYSSNYTNDALIEAVSGAVANLSDHSPHNRKMLGTSNTIKISTVLLYILPAYNKLTFEQSFNLVMALCHLCTSCPENISTVAFSQFGDAIAGILNKYSSYFLTSNTTSSGVGSPTHSHATSDTAESTANIGRSVSPDFSATSTMPAAPATSSSSLSAPTSSSAITIMTGLRQSNDYDLLLEAVCLLISHLSCDKVAQYRQGVNANVAKLLVSFLQRAADRRGSSMAYHASLLCMTLNALSFKSPENQAKLAQTNICKAIVTLFEVNFFGGSSDRDGDGFADLGGGSSGGGGEGLSMGAASMKLGGMMRRMSSTILGAAVDGANGRGIMMGGDGLGSSGLPTSLVPAMTSASDIVAVGIGGSPVNVGTTAAGNGYQYSANSNKLSSSGASRPSLLIEACLLVANLARGSEAARAKLLSSALVDMLTSLLTSLESGASMGGTPGNGNPGAIEASIDAVRLAMDAVVSGPSSPTAS